MSVLDSNLTGIKLKIGFNTKKYAQELISECSTSFCEILGFRKKFMNYARKNKNFIALEKLDKRSKI